MGRIAPNGTPVVVQTGASVIVVNSAGEILMQQRQAYPIFHYISMIETGACASICPYGGGDG